MSPWPRVLADLRPDTPAGCAEDRVPYLIDGNNLLGSWGGPAVPGDGRVEVLRRVAEFCRARGARATIVFDGAPFRPELGGQQLGRVSIRFPEEGSDADAVIREMVDRASRPAELIVVSSDKAVYSYARTRGASAMRAHEFNAQARGRTHHPKRPRSEPSEKPDHEPDIEGWLERFSK